MAELKTKLTDNNISDFLNDISDEKKHQDAFVLLEVFKEVTGEEPVIWGSSIVGFGTYHEICQRS